ncbi:hypothetical protein [Geomicrobium sediminis]|uniref:Subunit of tRNA(5-methylaminomethyl-2-thiouridylate) methyltransferase n=1 Tax=Geomicrobium sediminis TaxID=1347788 RepID=A0ABS2PD51_9BACL|nr:hypothetical protein [Geomicrobium sediminis]MBM7632886.1 putative subunit of tRNA(5-methylaminomethyl-2-thiouridylate) methyltransferase [Geomicrobium sediminis]
MMRLNVLLLILLGMVVSITALVFGIIAPTAIASTLAQIIGFSGLVFTFLYGLLMNRSTAKV